MGCFIVPGALAVVTTAFRKKVPARLHIGWLNTLLMGGTAALAIEHIAHQEIVPYFPYLTSASLSEMAVVGSAMTLACIGVWAAMVVVYNRIHAKTKLTQTA